MRYEGPERIKGMILWGASLGGAKAVPGSYKVQMTLNNQTMTKPFTILPRPDSEATIEDMQAQFDFVEDINTTIDRAHKAIKNIRLLNKKLKDFQSQYADQTATKALRDQAKSLQETLSVIEKKLYQTQNRSNQDPLNFPIKLTNKLGHLTNLVMMGDFGPTAQDRAVRDEMTAKINDQLDRYNSLLNQEVKAFNTAFKSLALDYLMD